MVVKQRAVPRCRSDCNFDTTRNESFLLPYGDNRLDKASHSKSADSIPKWSPLQTVMESTQPKQSLARKFVLAAPTLVKISIFAALCFSIYSLRSELSKRNKDIVTLRQDFEYLETELKADEVELDRTHALLSNLQSRFGELLPEEEEEKKKAGGEEFNGETVYNKIAERHTAMQARVNELQLGIADINRVEALEQFGSHEHKIKFNLLIDENIFSFVVEMAPLELMPHSVNYFMQMVKAEVWDDSIFTHGSGHVLLAELTDSKGNDKRELFLNKGITPLSFPEYNADYPHHKYTLGFGGNPGGPGFYINTQDNSNSHGPRRQTDSDLGNDADSCFATVIEGLDVIDWMQQRSSIAGDEDKSSEIYTVIESIRMIPS